MIKVPYQKDLILPQTPAGTMSHYLWLNNGYTPAACFYWVYNQQALRLRLTAEVGAPTVYTLCDDGAVWEDHCMEFFFKPFDQDNAYLNLECNALGCMVIEKGAGREGRTRLTATVKPQLDVTTVVRPGKGWEITYTIPFKLLEELYGRPMIPQKGTAFNFNMYICGEKTPKMHFGTCFPINTPAPDFHRPEFFGKGVLD